MMGFVEQRIATVQTVVFGLGMVLVGFWFGTNYAGRLAYQPEPKLGSTPTLPDWIHTLQATNQVVLIIAGLLFASLILLDYYSYTNNND